MITIRKPVVAGSFYPSGKEQLQKQTNELLSWAKITAKYKIVITPHAGYKFSGATAAKAIAGLKNTKKLVIVGPNHTGIGGMFSLMKEGTWETPLGNVEVDTELASKMLTPPLQNDPEAHLEEHSIEVLLPLLQTKYGQSFRFVPVSILNMTYDDSFLEDCVQVGDVLSNIDGLGLVASTDFSHYVPYEEAHNKDIIVLDKIKAMDIAGLFEVLRRNECSVCGYGPIAVAMRVAEKMGLKPEIINSSTSGDVTGDKDSVVSYHAIGFA